MSTSENLEMLAKYLSGECTDQEKKQVEAKVASEPELKKMLQFMQRVWEASEEQQSSDIEMLWSQVAAKAGIKMPPVATSSHRLPRRGFADNYPWIMRVAATILIIFTIGYFIKQTDLFWNTQELMTMTVQNGERKEVTLNDGTRIILDSGSTLSYPRKFDSEEREVILSGEGFFEVARNPEKPFVVRANYGVIRVLGTKFNVRAWAESQNVAVAVTEGKVSLNSTAGAEDEAAILTKDQFSEVRADGKPTVPDSVDVSRYLAWMKNEVFFEDAPLHEIFSQIERWHDVKFVFDDQDLANENLNIHLTADALEDVLSLITALTDLQFERNGKTIHVTR